MNKALRRFHKERMKEKCKRIYPYALHPKQADYLAVCSCPMCGNPRRHFKAKTKQEYLHELKLYEEGMTKQHPRYRKRFG